MRHRRKLCLAVTRQKGTLEPGYWSAPGSPVRPRGSSAPPSRAPWCPGSGRLGRPLKAVFPLVFLVLTVLLCTSVPLALVAVLGAVLSVIGAAYLPPWLEHRDRRLPGEPRRFTPGTRPPPARARVTISRRPPARAWHDRQLSSAGRCARDRQRTPSALRRDPWRAVAYRRHGDRRLPAKGLPLVLNLRVAGGPSPPLAPVRRPRRPGRPW